MNPPDIHPRGFFLPVILQLTKIDDSVLCSTLSEITYVALQLRAGWVVMPGKGFQLLDMWQEGLSILGNEPCKQPVFDPPMLGICPHLESLVHFMLILVLCGESIELLTPGFFFFRISRCHFVEARQDLYIVLESKAKRMHYNVTCIYLLGADDRFL